MRILLIAENRELCASLSFPLEKAGCQTDICGDGADVSHYLSQHRYDLIVLDQLQHTDGQGIVKKLRADIDTTPVIFLDTAKPLGFEELLTKIREISPYPPEADRPQSEVFRSGDITFYSTKRLLAGPAGQCMLSQKEGTLLQVFLANPSQTLTRQMLLSKVWGPDAEVAEGNLDNYMYLVRRRLKSVGSGIKIHTIRGIGYQLEEG